MLWIPQIVLLLCLKKITQLFWRHRVVVVTVVIRFGRPRLLGLPTPAETVTVWRVFTNGPAVLWKRMLYNNVDAHFCVHAEPATVAFLFSPKPIMEMFLFSNISDVRFRLSRQLDGKWNTALLFRKLRLSVTHSASAVHNKDTMCLQTF